MRRNWKNPADWHRWFAWRPVIDFKNGQKIWWEYCWRRRLPGMGGFYDYRVLEEFETPPEVDDYRVAS